MIDMTYEDAYKYIKKAEGAGIVPGLSTIKELLSRLGDPQDSVNVIHIAGTNGKGSIFAFLEYILRAAGYRVGRYISPTIFTYLERFQINSRYMTEEEFAEIMEAVGGAASGMEADGLNYPTAFELETAMAFLYFKKKKVDFLLLETGMGGRLDATNVVKKPLCTVLASISMDHMKFLGNDLSGILREKMGIMRPGVPCVAYQLQETLRPAYLEECERLAAPADMCDFSRIRITAIEKDYTEYIYDDKCYRIALNGLYQVYNSVVAIEVARCLNRYSGCSITDEQIKKGLAAARWKGRFERVGSDPDIYIDGAHNVGGWQSLAQNVREYFKDKRLIYVCGVFKDKEYEKMLDIMAPYSDTLIAVTPPNEKRALPKEALAQAAEKHFQNVYTAKTATEAVKRAVDLSRTDFVDGKTGIRDREKTVVLAFGSLSFIGELSIGR